MQSGYNAFILMMDFCSSSSSSRRLEDGRWNRRLPWILCSSNDG